MMFSLVETGQVSMVVEVWRDHRKKLIKLIIPMKDKLEILAKEVQNNTIDLNLITLSKTIT